MDKKELTKDEFVKEGKRMYYFPECMSFFIRELESAGKYAAVHTYTCTFHSFTEFLGGEAVKAPINEIFTPGNLKSYQEWLLNKALSWNSISTYMRTLRAVVNRIFPPGSPGHIPGLFDNVYTKVESQTKRALTGRQMQTLLSVDFREVSIELRRTLGYFRLMFLFRGMPFIDLAHLRKRDVQGNVIMYCRHKTGRRLTVRIPKAALSLLKEFSDKNSDSIYLFPILEGKLQNGAELHRSYQSALCRFNKQLVQLSSRLLLGVKVSSYTARHTWATLSFHLGIPVGIISEALGHSSVRVTETYLKPFENERVDKANDKLIISVIKCKQKSSSNFNLLYDS